MAYSCLLLPKCLHTSFKNCILYSVSVMKKHGLPCKKHFKPM